MDKNRIYFAIDLKSFYASVECVERGLDSMDTNLLVADEGRTEKTICLAVSPSLKAYGISGRARLFEAIQQIKKVNLERKRKSPTGKLEGKSYFESELKKDKTLAVDYIVAPPRMALYSKYSSKIYGVYLKYFSSEDIHDYSIDEVFIDATDYIHAQKTTPQELVKRVIKEVLSETGITATAGIGTNLYLCKVAMDIVAKHAPADADGVRIAYLDEKLYRETLWNHRPLTDFWRVGNGYADKLEANGIYTMGDVAKCSVGSPSARKNEGLLYKLFGVNAELLIDHAWGWEPCGMADIKAYKPSTNSLSSGQVLHVPYDATKARLIVNEMVDSLVLDLVANGLVTNQIVLTIGYDVENVTNPNYKKYSGEIVLDRYGRKIPKHNHGTINLNKHTSSTKLITEATLKLYDNIINANLLIRRINVVASRLITEKQAEIDSGYTQLNMFTDYAELRAENEREKKEKSRQKAVIGIKRKYGKNAILKGMNLEEGATAKDRNEQIGGHKA